MLLAASVAARLVWTYLVPNGANFVDLHVYIGGAAALDHPGSLYSYVYADQTPDFPLPFTYPPFAALVFYPLHLLPFGLVAFCWQVGIVAALYGVVRVSQRLLGVAAGEGHRTAMLWTAVAIWIEPLRSTFDYGQVNVILVLGVLYAAYSSRWWLSGLLVGLAAGVKLTPAVTGLYFLGMRRWAAAVFSAVVFLATVGLSIAVIGQQARYYFTDLLGDASRIGPIGTSFNQSWRGGISRILGHDAGYGPLVLAAIAVTAVLALLAWRALGDDGDRDRLGSLLVVQLTGLADLTDLVDAPLGLVGAVDDLAHPRAVANAARRTAAGLELAGADGDRGAVAAQFRPADDLAGQPTVVPGLGRAGLHRGDAGDAGLGRG